ncbi:hypothetical protein AVEN_203442-1 [Araneus ventricosus]|uniref:Uncharacterized protein n=1 Tax=Araneus ventricosus TaxID=182803 RepID=A0A4Y2BH48_ARAVE|nr:hypothetical protein AVEN_203442-1 [Araneus ventricosus]
MFRGSRINVAVFGPQCSRHKFRFCALVKAQRWIMTLFNVRPTPQKVGKLLSPPAVRLWRLIAQLWCLVPLNDKTFKSSSRGTKNGDSVMMRELFGNLGRKSLSKGGRLESGILLRRVRKGILGC